MTCAPCYRHSRRGGFTLTELLIVIVIMGLILGIAGPRFVNWIRYFTARSATSQVVADLALARTQAVREGQTVSIQTVDGDTYRVLVETVPARTIKTVDVAGAQGTVSLGVPAGTRIAFDSRGMLRPGSATQLTVSYGGNTDVVSITGVGRVYRED
jgi:prepilin-type N-terminal cleavage/methylation domain-containing protein